MESLKEIRIVGRATFLKEQYDGAYALGKLTEKWEPWVTAVK